MAVVIVIEKGEVTPPLVPTTDQCLAIIRTLATRIYHRESKSLQQEALRILELLDLVEAR